MDNVTNIDNARKYFDEGGRPRRISLFPGRIQLERTDGCRREIGQTGAATCDVTNRWHANSNDLESLWRLRQWLPEEIRLKLEEAQANPEVLHALEEAGIARMHEARKRRAQAMEAEEAKKRAEEAKRLQDLADEPWPDVVWLESTYADRERIKASKAAVYVKASERWRAKINTLECLRGIREWLEPHHREMLDAKLAMRDNKQEQEASILPWWPPEARGMPNAMIRSALFGVVRRGRREYQRGVTLQSIGGMSVKYTGERLDQADLDVWLGIMELFKGQDIAQRRGQVVVGAREFLRSIGRPGGGSSITWLHKSLARLSATNVEISYDRRIYGGSLIVRYARDERTGQLMVEIDPKIAALFQPTTWTKIDWEERHALGSDQLALWLHAFYSSHAEPFPIKVATLQEWSGAEARGLFHFRAEIREAMARIAKATGWTWEIDCQDRLRIKRPMALPEPEGGDHEP